MFSRWRLATTLAVIAAFAQSLQQYFSMLGHGHTFMRILSWHLLVDGLWVGLAPVLLAFGRHAARARRTPALYVRGLRTGLLITAVHIAVSTALTLAIQPWTPLYDYSVTQAARSSFVYHIPVDVLLCCVLIAVGYSTALAALEAEVARANLEALRLEIRPHFLFNTLNSISALIRNHDNERALNMLVGLSTLMRTSIEQPQRGLVSLTEELAFLGQYVEIQQVRFADRVNVSCRVDRGCADLRVPMLLLQPLVENAYRHGMTTDSDRLAIEVSAQATPNRVTVLVTDDGAGPPEGFDLDTDAGAGLRNVRARLQQIYGDDCRFSVSRRLPRGTVAEIVFPVDSHANAALEVTR